MFFHVHVDQTKQGVGDKATTFMSLVLRTPSSELEQSSSCIASMILPAFLKGLGPTGHRIE